MKRALVLVGAIALMGMAFEGPANEVNVTVNGLS